MNLIHKKRFIKQRFIKSDSSTSGRKIAIAKTKVGQRDIQSTFYDTRPTLYEAAIQRREDVQYDNVAKGLRQ